MENDVQEKDDLVQLDEVLSELRENARGLAKDLISGIEMFRVQAATLLTLVLFMGLFALIFLLVFPFFQGGECCYVLTYSNLAGGIAGVAGIVVFSWRAVSLRRKYVSLRFRYRKILELEEALGK